jgi:aminopeptidase
VSNPRLARLADVLVGYSAGVQPGELVLLEAPVIVEPLLEEMYRAVLEAGGQPVTRVGLDLAEVLYGEGSDDQISWVNPARREDIERADVRIVIEASGNTKALTNVEPGRQALSERSRAGLRDRYLERALSGELRWVLSAYPTNAAAQDAEMSLSEYEDFIYDAALLDDGDPVARWRKFAKKLEAIAKLLETKDELRVVAEGTDLTVAVGGRRWIAADGHENFPDGEVFTAPHERSAEGEIRFTYPAVFRGREVDDIRLRFHEGEVVEASAARGQDFLEEMIGVDDGARRLGEFAFGMNDAVQEFTGHTLFDEKLGGTVHMALGKAYPESGGTNESALHWDLVCDLRGDSEVFADGEVVYRNGEFLPDLF